MIRPDTDSTIVSPGDTILMLGDLESVKKARLLIESPKMKWPLLHVIVKYVFKIVKIWDGIKFGDIRNDIPWCVILIKY